MMRDLKCCAETAAYFGIPEVPNHAADWSEYYRDENPLLFLYADLVAGRGNSSNTWREFTCEYVNTRKLMDLKVNSRLKFLQLRQSLGYPVVMPNMCQNQAVQNLQLRLKSNRFFVLGKAKELWGKNTLNSSTSTETAPTTFAPDLSPIPVPNDRHSGRKQKLPTKTETGKWTSDIEYVHFTGAEKLAVLDAEKRNIPVVLLDTSTNYGPALLREVEGEILSTLK